MEFFFEQGCVADGLQGLMVHAVEFSDWHWSVLQRCCSANIDADA